MEIGKKYNIKRIREDFKKIKSEELREGGFGISICDEDGDCINAGLVNEEDIIGFRYGDVNERTLNRWSNLSERAKINNAIELWDQALDEGSKELEIAKSIETLEYTLEDTNLLDKINRKYKK